MTLTFHRPINANELPCPVRIGKILKSFSFCKITDRTEGTDKLQTLQQVVGKAVKRLIISRVHFQKHFLTVDVNVSVPHSPAPFNVGPL